MGKLFRATLEFMDRRNWKALAAEIRGLLGPTEDKVETELELGASQNALEAEQIQLVRAALLLWVAEGKPATWQIGRTRSEILTALTSRVAEDQPWLSGYLAGENRFAAQRQGGQGSAHPPAVPQVQPRTLPPPPPPMLQSRTQAIAPTGFGQRTQATVPIPPAIPQPPQGRVPPPLPQGAAQPFGQHGLPTQATTPTSFVQRTQATTPTSFTPPQQGRVPPPPPVNPPQPPIQATAPVPLTSGLSQPVRRRLSLGPPPTAQGKDPWSIAEELLKQYRTIVVMDPDLYNPTAEAKALATKQESSGNYLIYKQSLMQIVKAGDKDGWYKLGATCLKIKMGNCQNLMAAMFKLLVDHEDWHTPLELVALKSGTAGHHFIVVNRPNAATKKINETGSNEWGDAFVVDLWLQNLHPPHFDQPGVIRCATYGWLHKIVGSLRQDLYWPGK